MTDPQNLSPNRPSARTMTYHSPKDIRFGQGGTPSPDVGRAAVAPDPLRVVSFLSDLCTEIDTSLDPTTPNPHLNMVLHLVRGHLEGRQVSQSALVATAGVPYATAVRKLNDLSQAGLIEQRPRTKSGKSYSLHPSPKLLERFTEFADRLERLGRTTFGETAQTDATEDYFFGGSYVQGQAAISPPPVLPTPLKLAGGVRMLMHGDPTFMVMETLKRQLEQIIGTNISQRAFSIDRLRQEALRNAGRSKSAYDLIAVDLPWIGEFAAKGVIRPLTDVMDVDQLDPSDFHTAGWLAAHWDGAPYGVPGQTTPELMFYRKDWFAREGLAPPVTTDDTLAAARHFHDPTSGRYGVAWNAARGTALGHTFMMTCADFGQPIIDLPRIAGGYDASLLAGSDIRPMFDSAGAREAAEYLMELLQYSPPDILSMSWYERVRPFAGGTVAMAYGYTLLAPYFELDPSCPAYGNTGYLPHPHGPNGAPIAPVGGYALCVPSNVEEDRLPEIAQALTTFTSPAAQKLYVLNGSRTSPRYSVGADPEVRRLSPIFELVDQMSWRDELQFWPRPPIPQISDIIQASGHVLHDMLRGIISPAEALTQAQAQTEQIIKDTKS